MFYKKIVNIEKSSWLLFIILVLASLLSAFSDSDLFQKYLGVLILYIPLAIVLLHSLTMISYKKTALFFLLIFIGGFIFEYFGLKSGILFGGEYIYHFQGTYILNVPFVVLLYWIVFIYTGYSITNSFLFWLKKEKPILGKSTLKLVGLLTLIDGIIVVAIDLFMDPIKIRLGDWQWLSEGLYYGVPIGNFFGWLLLVCIVTGSFRIFEYYQPEENLRKPHSFYILPIAVYSLLFISFLYSAYFLNFTFITALPMLLVILIHILVVNRSRFIVKLT